ncbi:MAG: D-glycero-beta-D-manno-heptose 1-phosphate adenylyltransferase [Bacteroidia bacterium]|nr:D-glycero-beta-D-manno-heptose 1-phosphate adenylyltransferase [Bacteroidia bacterium]
MNYTEIIQKKISTREELLARIASWRIKNVKIVFTNGVFDLLHPGHVDYLARARDCGNRLIVAVNSDASVKKLNKGQNRPIQDEKSRAFIIASLHVVDAVVIFNEDTPQDLIAALLPDVLVKGADYKVEDIAGHEIVKKNGGEVKLIELLPGFSTTAIEKRIRE